MPYRWAAQLLPESLDDSQRLKVLLRYAVGAAKRPRLDFLLARFDEDAESDRVLDQLNEFVGHELLNRVGEAAAQ
jgi:hypothetical protein